MPNVIVSVRQVVAYNIVRARRERGMTQDELGKQLEKLTGLSFGPLVDADPLSGPEETVLARSRELRHPEDLIL